MSENVINSNDVWAMGINIASPEMIRSWSFGEVINPETMNYKKMRPEPGGLFCERIFGPVKDLECSCGEYKGEINRGHICEKCGVEVTDSSVRRERMGHIELATPIAHIWYGSRNPSFIAILLDLSRGEYDSIAYCEKYIVTEVDKTAVSKEIEKYEDILARAGSSSPEGEAPEDTQKFIDVTMIVLEELKNLQPKTILTFEINKILKEYAPDCFKSGTGGGAIRTLLAKIDIDKTYDELSSEIVGMKESSAKQKLVDKLKIVSAFKFSGNRPEWMVLTVLPVIPPDIRPMLQLDGGKFAASDINEFYRKIVMRNNRLKALIKIEAPEAIINNEKRMLQRAVDNLFDNSENNRKAALKKLPPMKSLSDTLKGKKGRFRMNLLGKRVDYSGRSVIIVGPKLRLYQCGLPKIMALDLYKPFVISELISMGYAKTVKGAKQIIAGHGPEVWKALSEVVKTRPVMLNRAPSLHRLSIQAFEPVLIEESAIQLHPLVCSAFNADFDGDQMAVHLPVSLEAAQEARDLMLASKNLLKPSDGEPIISPSKDMVLGIFCLTMEMKGEHKNDGMVFFDYDDVKYSFDIGEVELYTKIRFRCKTWYDENDKRMDKPEIRFINTTVGRVFFNYIFDERMMFRNVQFGKGKIKDVISDTFAICGQDATAILSDKIKDIGFEYSMKSGVTIAVSDITVPPEREPIIEASEKREKELKKLNRRGQLTSEELEKETVNIWTKTKDNIGDAIKKHMDPEGNMAIMANSGATKGGFGPISQLAGMRGLMADPSGRVITLPIKSNIKMGMSAIEYFIATHGARKGLADTALRTADAGYMTRRLVDVTQDIIINAEDCGTKEGVIVDRNVEIAQEKFSERLFSRILAEDVVDPETGETLYKRGQLIHYKEAKAIENSKVQTVKVRSPMTCELKHGICAQCYGLDIARNAMVKVGEAVGTMAAQSIGEPGTQLTLRTFHSGGTAGAAGDITAGLPRVEELFEARIPKVEAVLSEYDGIAEINEESNVRTIVIKADDEKGNVLARYKVGPNQKIITQNGSSVSRGDTLTSGALNLYKLLELKGRVECFLYILREAQNVYRPQGQSINDKHFEMIIRKMLQFVRITDPGDSDYTVGALESYIGVNIKNRELAEQGKVPASYKDVLLGMSKASLSIDSWLSAASFQHTVDVLALAGIRGDVDYLRGLKENIIIGKLIPAGTGFDPKHVEKQNSK